MKIKIYNTKEEMAKSAAAKAAEVIINTIKTKGRAYFVAATGSSQFEFLNFLTSYPGIDWSKTIMFHLDEYIGIDEKHPASFRKYLFERLINKVHPGEVHLIKGDAENPKEECKRLSEIISKVEIDVAFVGIGENGHLAFNDPPADFETEEPYIIVNLDEKCRKQQVGEGWFRSLDEVPKQAISMSIKQIMKSKNIICTVPDERKAEAVRNCFEKEISPLYPASILRKHPNAFVFLDRHSSKLLSERWKK
jgi:glucosamine-6-phosphate deaminase